jgi:hypothetical protein
MSAAKTFWAPADAIIQTLGGEKVFVTTQASGAASASLTISGLKDVDNVLVIPPSPGQSQFAQAGGPNYFPTPTAQYPAYQQVQSVTLVLQGTQDFYYYFSDVAGTATSTNSVLVKAGAQERVNIRSTRTAFNVIQSTAAGVVSIFVIRYQ